MTRNGKIAHLPEEIREELNLRLLDNLRARDILPWLNDLPEVRAILERHFGGREIRADNLTHWRQGGFQAWLNARDSPLLPTNWEPLPLEPMELN